MPDQIKAFDTCDGLEIPLFLTNLIPTVEKEFTDVMKKDFVKRMESWPQNWDGLHLLIISS